MKGKVIAYRWDKQQQMFLEKKILFQTSNGIKKI